MPAPCAFLLTELVFPVKSCGLQVLWTSLLLAHMKGWRRGTGRVGAETLAEWKMQMFDSSGWFGRKSLPLHFPDGVQLFAIPSCLFSNLVANHSSALVRFSFPPSHQLSLLAHLLTSWQEQICCLVWSPLAQPSQAISASPPWQKVSESPFICFSFYSL